jgi:hypothetical protein
MAPWLEPMIERPSSWQGHLRCITSLHLGVETCAWTHQFQQQLRASLEILWHLQIFQLFLEQDCLRKSGLIYQLQQLLDVVQQILIWYQPLVKR